MKTFFICLAMIATLALGSFSSFAWDYEGHRVVNQLALSLLPTNFPDFVREPQAAERIAFLSGEPDRWRNVQDLPLRHCNGPDHYIDLEQLRDYELNPELLPVFRYDFVAQLAIYRQSHPDKFPAESWGRNEDRTRQLVGLLPWSIAENYSKLKACFSYWKTFQQSGGTADEIKNAEHDILYVMGVMGHYVGDATQPLHTTVHHHGWVGSNPEQYTTNSRIHSWIDGGFFGRSGHADEAKLKTNLRPARPLQINGHDAKPEEVFQAAMLFIVEQHKQVEPLYLLEKQGKLSGKREADAEGKALLEGQLARAGQWLGDLWYSAWQQAPTDSFLEGQLSKRKQAQPTRKEQGAL